MNPVKLVVKLVEEEPLVESAEHDLNYRMQRYHSRCRLIRLIRANGICTHILLDDQVFCS